MANAMMIVSLTWSLMRANETWLNGSLFTDAVLFVAMTALVWIALNPDVIGPSAPGDD